MSTISIKTKMDELGIEMDDLAEEMAQDMVAVAAQLSRLTYNKIVEETNNRLHSTRMDYIDALHLVQESEGTFVVYLDPEANHLEDGYPPHHMLPALATGPKSKVAKDGHRYVTIPLRQRTSPANPQGEINLHPLPGGGGFMKGTQADLAARLRDVVQNRKFKKIKTGISPKTGKYTTVERLTEKNVHPYLKGLTRVREYKSPGDKRPISSAYFTFRTASTKQDAGKHWTHPGFQGVRIFPDVERWANEQAERIIKEFFGA